MGRIVALDYGKKRVGVAVTDPLQLIANGLDTIETTALMAFLRNYLTANSVDTIVVGMPRQMNGEPSESYRYIKPFVERLRKEFAGLPIELVDERFTSVLAQRTLIEGGIPKMERRNNKGLVDRVSATIILQSYLEQQRIKTER